MTLHIDPDFAVLDEPTRRLLERGLVTVVTPPDGLTDVQARLVKSFGEILLGIDDFDPYHSEPLPPEQLVAALEDAPESTRKRTAQLMIILELVLKPLPEVVCLRVAATVRALHVDEGMVQVAIDYAHGAYGLALKDFERNGYFHHVGNSEAIAQRLHIDKDLTEPFEHRHHDETLYNQWAEFNSMPPGSLGQEVARFYRSRGFTYPGHVGSVSPTLAQHDFVHVLGDYGAVIDSEIETFAMIAGSVPDARGFSWLASMVGLFETGFIPTAAGGVLEAEEGHLSRPGMTLRLADALRRGREVNRDLMYGIDYFELAPLPLDEVRRMLGVPPKDPAAIEAGSAGVFERAGYTEWQLEHGDASLQPEG